MNVLTVEFVSHLPVIGPVFVEVRGVRHLLPMEFRDEVWSLAMEFPPGVYLYRFHVADAAIVNDHRRTTQKTVDGELWSVVHVTDQGPVWVNRTHLTLVATDVCRGVSEMMMPLVVLEQARVAEFPIVFWTHVRHLYQDSLMQIFMIRPDRELVFCGEFILECSKASSEFDLKFWLNVDLDPESVLPGMWEFHAVVESGSPIVKRMLVEV